MNDPVPSSAIYDATVGGLSLIVVAGGSTGDVLTKQSDGTYAAATPASSGIGGSVGSTTNRLVKSSGTGGLTVQSTGIEVDASNNVSGVGTLSSGAITSGSTVQSSASAAPWYMGRFRGSNGGGIGLDGGGNPTIMTANSNQTIGITGASAKVFSPFVFGWINATNVGQQLIDQTLDVAVGFGGSGIVEINNGTTGTLRDLSCRAITASGLLCVGAYTFATVPSASSNSGKFLRISDRAQKHAYSDGTNWRFFGDDAIIS